MFIKLRLAFCQYFLTNLFLKLLYKPKDITHIYLYLIIYPPIFNQYNYYTYSRQYLRKVLGV